jgi:hypothetical protein
MLAKRLIAWFFSVPHHVAVIIRELRMEGKIGREEAER